MSEPIEAPALHIAREHQSSPKELPEDRAVREAAQEIADGKFVPSIEPDNPLLMLAVGVERGMIPADPNQIDTNALLQTELLCQHPRVQDALRQLEEQRDNATNPQEYLEKQQMIFELNREAAKPNQWDGQDRWIGKENEEMRIGQPLTAFNFIQKLQQVIGDRRVQLNRFAVANRVALLAPEELTRGMILMPGQTPTPEGFYVVGTLQYPVSAEWMLMRFDEWGVPTTPKYLGWRTALLSMITLGVITEKEAHLAFPLDEGPASAWYREQLFMLRARTGTLD